MGGCSGKPCIRRKKKVFSGGSILDRVISQSSNQDQCLLYKLANYKKGGELLDAYNIGGQAECEKLIRDQFGQLMYQEGKGQIINRSEYLRWKFRDQEQVILPIEASLSRYDPLGKWTDHEACWQMQYRGSLGETLLHVLIMCDTKIHTRLARTLIRCFPRLAIDVVEGEEYLGASALHLAIAYTNNELVQDLVEAGANVNQRAIGSFFLPRDQQKAKPAKYTDYEGLAYLGEYPLAWAACCANESVYNLLLDNGAHPDLQDDFGNMILHMVVVCDKLDMFGYALRHPRIPASNGIINTSGLTPLTLACKLGRAEVFREMLELSAKEFWRYSNITCSAYTLNALDTLLPNGQTNWNSALFIILNGTKEEHLDMLDGGIIQRLLEEKWKAFARNQFLKRLLILVTHLLCMSLAIYLRPDDPDESLVGWSDDPKVIARFAAEVATILGVLSYIIIQQGDEIRNQGFWTFLKQQSNSPPKWIFLLSNLMILACIPCRLSGDRKIEETILLFAVPGSWFLLMFFAGAVRLTGPFVTMIYSMITGDMLTFGIIYTIVLFGFSQSFFFLYKGHPNVNGTLYHSYSSTWMALFQITLGNYDYSELAMTTYPSVARSVFALFMVFVPILLLNMLIAMMGNTYAHVTEQSEKEWVKQWAKIVISLERAIPQKDAHNYLQDYSISLGPAEDPSTEQRGVMVIKSKSKTRAKQRKGAVANWKRVGKVTITALKKRGMTGEEMRCLMWGRESINTPIKIKGKKKDPLSNAQGPNLAEGVGDALTSALDVLAFTHDLDINAEGLNLANNVKPIISNKSTSQQIRHNNVALNNQINLALNMQNGVSGVTSNSGMLGMFTQLTAPQDIPEKSKSPMITTPILSNNINVVTKPTVTQTTTIFNNMPIPTDPLKELVLHSLEKHHNPETLKFLAHAAAHAPQSEEVVIPNKTKINSNVKSLAGLFAGTEALVRKVEEQVKKKYSALEPSDSEDLGGMLGMFTQLTAPQDIPEKSKSPMITTPILSNNINVVTKPTVTQTTTIFNNMPIPTDPLKELVLHSLEKHHNPETLKFLAHAAAHAPQSEEVVIPNKTKINSNVKSLAGLFAGTEALVRKVEEQVKKKYSALEPSDSEDLGEVILGKTSRTKRAKSARLRKSSEKPKTSDKRKLVASSDSSSTESPRNDPNKDQKDKTLMDYAEERIRTIKEDIRANSAHCRPINIDVALGVGDMSANVCDLPGVEGNGEEATLQASSYKEKQKKRSKTAKNNRVAPITQEKRSSQSARLHEEDPDEVPSSPDPLDAWSTKNIADMNQILAWEKEDDSI